MLNVVAFADGQGVVARLALALADEEAAMHAIGHQDLFRLIALDHAVEPGLGLDGLEERKRQGGGGWQKTPGRAA